ncbi:MAG: hypothetical protein ACTH8M_01215, partial [Microbacterium gubbeenense]
HRTDIVDDAAALLDSLSAGLVDDDLMADLPVRDRADVSEAIALLDRMPQTTPNGSDTSMHTDQFDPDELRLHSEESWDAAPPRTVDPDDATRPVDDATQPVDVDEKD